MLPLTVAMRPCLYRVPLASKYPMIMSVRSIEMLHCISVCVQMCRQAVMDCL